MIINMPLEFGPCSLPTRPVTDVSAEVINYKDGTNEVRALWTLPPVYDVQIGKIGIYGYMGEEEPIKFSQFELITEVSDSSTSATAQVDKTYNYILVAPISTDEVIQKDLNQMINCKVTMNMPLKETFSTMSWEDIDTVSVNGYASEYFEVGDTKSVNIGGTNYNVAIYDFDHDDKADGTGKVGMTIGLVNCLSTYYQMNSSNTNSGGWEVTQLRTKLQSTIFEQLPAELRNVIKNVSKYTRLKTSNDVITEDNLFLLSEHEWSNNIMYAPAKEGTQYAYFTVDTDNRVNKKLGDSGASCKWWTRSQVSNDSAAFCNVNKGLSYDKASYNYGVSFAFCI